MTDYQMATSKDYPYCFFFRAMSSPLAEVAETSDFGTEDPSLSILLLNHPMLHTDKGGEATCTELHDEIAIPTACICDQIFLLISFT